MILCLFGKWWPGFLVRQMQAWDLWTNITGAMEKGQIYIQTQPERSPEAPGHQISFALHTDTLERRVLYKAEREMRT